MMRANAAAKARSGAGVAFAPFAKDMSPTLSLLGALLCGLLI